MNIILASGSPRRKKLLEQINLPFTVEASEVEEKFNPRHPPSQIVGELALKKATQIAEGRPGVLVIGADTVVVFEDAILEKPATKHEAFGMLSRLSGQTHRVLTGVALVKTDTEGNIIDTCPFSETTHVTFGELDENEIHEYIETGSPMDKAGAYGIQDDWGALFVKKIEGDYYNVVGFPLHSFYTKLKQFSPGLVSHSINPQL